MIETSSVHREFVLKWRFGLRTAMLVHRVASRYASSIELTFGRQRVDAKDLISLACFGPVGPKLADGTPNSGPYLGEVLGVSVSGSDADAAVAAMTDLFTAGADAPRCLQADCRSTPILIGLDARALEYSCSKLHMWAVERATGRVLLT
jgi:phosphotransferase system HPr-like phosphotransfer protein